VQLKSLSTRFIRLSTKQKRLLKEKRLV